MGHEAMAATMPNYADLEECLILCVWLIVFWRGATSLEVMEWFNQLLDSIEDLFESSHDSALSLDQDDGHDDPDVNVDEDPTKTSLQGIW
eukprot:CAMPEP_0168754758 /NCGR_PEP_ID=MMETSP0724-20121128/19675_1 /TAXON_ID=265536 /ORGANISM="Amphiprora sp., Strain CCMP467" /LENGTH=89 /DNA_ID=CAMNT_0008803265 /DNA_START=184 /DNA_END=451 /DNA_ORIENTATION=-